MLCTHLVYNVKMENCICCGYDLFNCRILFISSESWFSFNNKANIRSRMEDILAILLNLSTSIASRLFSPEILFPTFDQTPIFQLRKMLTLHILIFHPSKILISSDSSVRRWWRTWSLTMILLKEEITKKNKQCNNCERVFYRPLLYCYIVRLHLLRIWNLNPPFRNNLKDPPE